VTRLEILRPFVEQTVKEFLGVEELKVLDDGTIPPPPDPGETEAYPTAEAEAEPGGYL
jgi:hypothetical protein